MNFLFRFKNRSKKVLNPNLQKVYTDKSGNDYFKFINPSLMPASRLLMAMILTGDADRSMNKHNLKHLCSLIDERINSNDLSGAAKINGLIQASLDLYADEETLLQLAQVYYLMNDENPETYSERFQKEKRKIWDEDIDAKGFFLQQSFKYTKAFQEQPQLNVLEYLNKAKPINQIKDLLKNGWQGFWKNDYNNTSNG